MVEGAAVSPFPLVPPGLYSPLSTKNTISKDNLNAFHKSNKQKAKPIFACQESQYCRATESLRCISQGTPSVIYTNLELLTR